MPWSVQKDDRCPASRPWAVVKEADNSLEGCHVSKADAQKQQAALYAQDSSSNISANVTGSVVIRSAPKDDLIRMTPLELTDLVLDRDGEGGDGGEGATVGLLHGYAAVFNRETLIDSWEGTFRETIKPGAFKRTLQNSGDKVKVLFNHGFDPSIGDKPLGKPRKIVEDSVGLYHETPMDDTSYNRDLASSLRSGAIDGQSFRFSVVREEWDEPDDKLPLRSILEAKLYEFGPVTWPAYEATTAGVRARDAFVAWRQANGNKTYSFGPVDSDTPDEGEADPPILALRTAKPLKDLAYAQEQVRRLMQ